MRTLEPIDHYEVPGRGLVRSLYDPDPPFQMGEMVLIDEVPHRIIGLERHPTREPKAGRAVGVLAVPAT